MSSAAEQEAVQEGRVEDGVPVERCVDGAAVPAPRAAPVLNGAPHPGPPVPVWPGASMPLGARFRVGPDGVAGTNFALWAGGAEAVELCLFDAEGVETKAPSPS